MQSEPIQVERHGQIVWENPTAEAIRKEECLSITAINASREYQVKLSPDLSSRPTS